MAFTPNSPHEIEFLRHIRDGSPITIIGGGRQTGKTITACAAIGLVVITLGHNKMGKGWVLTPSIDQTKQAKISFEKVMGWKVQGGLIQRFLAHENCYILDLAGRDYRVEFKTADNPNLLRGGVLDWIYLDEAGFLKPEVWEIVQPCVIASGGPIWLTSTPNGLNWFYDLYRKGMAGDSRIKSVHAKSKDNPALPPKLLAAMMDGYSEERKRVEFEAEFIHSQGLIYTAFKDEFIKEPPKGFSGECIAGIDPGAGDPFAYITVVRNQQEFWVVDEYYSDQPQTLQRHVSNIGRGDWEGMVGRRWCDPSRAQDRLDLMNTYGLDNWAAKNALESGINAVKEKFENRKLMVSPKCKNLIRELRNYCYNKDGHPIDKDNHCLDALRYIIFSEKNFSGSNEVHIPINNGAHYGVLDEKGFNEVYMPDGSVIPGWSPKDNGAAPGGRYRKGE